jgi:hypothetical protein
MNYDPDRYPNRRFHAGLVPGVILVAIGALFFLNNLHIVYVRDFLRFWPGILIAIGVVKLVDSTEMGGKVGGGVLLGVGAILMAQTLGYLDGLSLRDMWPLILIAVGVVMLFQRGLAWRIPYQDRTLNVGTLDEAAVFGGGKRNIVSENFRGGKLSAVFGGFELDLRKANMVGDSAVLHVDAVFGGVEIKIPETWSAVLRGTAVFGGYSDESRQPREDSPGYKRLFLEGSAVFGGVVVKN